MNANAKNAMTKTELLGVYQTSFNHIQLTYASLILWSYPDTSEYFDEIYKQMDNIPRPFPNLNKFIVNSQAMRIACEELYDSAHRSALKDLFPITKTYFYETGQLEALKSQPWFQFWRILRNYFAHDMIFNFSKEEKALLPVSWGGVIIDLSMNREKLTHGQFSRDKLRELLEAIRTFIAYAA